MNKIIGNLIFCVFLVVYYLIKVIEFRYKKYSVLGLLYWLKILCLEKNIYLKISNFNVLRYKIFYCNYEVFFIG